MEVRYEASGSIGGNEQDIGIPTIILVGDTSNDDCKRVMVSEMQSESERSLAQRDGLNHFQEQETVSELTEGKPSPSTEGKFY